MVIGQLPGSARPGATPSWESACRTASHRKFIEKYALPFPLIADTELKLVNELGVWGEKSLYGRKYMGAFRAFITGKAESWSASSHPRRFGSKRIEQIWANGAGSGTWTGNRDDIGPPCFVRQLVAPDGVRFLQLLIGYTVPLGEIQIRNRGADRDPLTGRNDISPRETKSRKLRDVKEHFCSQHPENVAGCSSGIHKSSALV